MAVAQLPAEVKSIPGEGAHYLQLPFDGGTIYRVEVRHRTTDDRITSWQEAGVGRFSKLWVRPWSGSILIGFAFVEEDGLGIATEFNLLGERFDDLGGGSLPDHRIPLPVGLLGQDQPGSIEFRLTAVAPRVPAAGPVRPLVCVTALVGAVVLGWVALRLMRRRAPHPLGACPQCGYLTVAGVQGCPECGLGRPRSERRSG